MGRDAVVCRSGIGGVRTGAVRGGVGSDGGGVTEEAAEAVSSADGGGAGWWGSVGRRGDTVGGRNPADYPLFRGRGNRRCAVGRRSRQVSVRGLLAGRVDRFLKDCTGFFGPV